jgi:hypothetical protein
VATTDRKRLTPKAEACRPARVKRTEVTAQRAAVMRAAASPSRGIMSDPYKREKCHYGMPAGTARDSGEAPRCAIMTSFLIASSSQDDLL